MREMDWAVLFDAAEERMGFVGNDRTALLAIMQNDVRLASLPQGSAAHFAAAYATLGKSAGDCEESVRLQEAAGQWLMKRWA